MPRDNGGRTDSRIIRLARPIVRSILYLAALQTSCSSALFRAFRDRLAAASKPVKAAIVTTAPKLLTNLNAMLAIGSDFNQSQTQLVYDNV